MSKPRGPFTADDVKKRRREEYEMGQITPEMVAFLREQHPIGSRIKLKEMKDDPRPIEPGSTGTLEHIDDAGQFHVKWDNGRELALIPGVDSFSVLAPEPMTLKLYMPLQAQVFGKNEWGDYSEEPTDLLNGHELLSYEDAIRGRLEHYREPSEAERGLMRYYGKDDGVNAKVLSAQFTVEERDRQLWGVAECRIVGSLSPKEKEALIDYISGQASDGWGEGFEQQEIKIDDGEMYVSFWNDGAWSIQTEQERFGPRQDLPDMCWSTLPGAGDLICIVRGEKGYSLSDWNTGDPAQNRRIADYANQKRGITPAQEEAMVIGSMAGWSSPGADPKVHQQKQAQQMGGMQLG